MNIGIQFYESMNRFVWSCGVVTTFQWIPLSSVYTTVFSLSCNLPPVFLSYLRESRVDKAILFYRRPVLKT